MIATVMGATGNTGHVVAEKLLAGGVQVRAIGRSADRLAALVSKGAKAVVGDVQSAADLTAAFRGSDAVYAMVPPFYSAPDVIAYYEQVGAVIARAIAESGVRKVVFLSSLGAELDAGTGPIVGLHRVEEKLKAVRGIDLLLLRPGYFFQNFFGSLGLIKHQGVNGGATKGDVPINMIAAGDIGALAAAALLEGDVTGVSVRELFGPRDLTMTEATRIFGAKIGKPDLPYVQFPDEGVIGGLQGAGFSRNIAESFVQMSHAFNAGKIRATQPRSATNTGTTTFESFAEVLAGAYRAA
jgi:uncharacterized protein YbjT (DUF2867 family)